MMSGKTKKRMTETAVLFCFTENVRLFLRVLYKLAEFGVKLVSLFKEFLAEAVEIGLLASFGGYVHLVLELIEEVDGLVEEPGKAFVGDGGIEGGDVVAIVHECAEHKLDVLFNSS